MVFLHLLACSADPAANPGDSASADSGSPADTATTPSPDPLPYSGGTCPVLVEGVNEGFASGEDARTFQVVLPAEPEGAGVIFAWHWLGGTSGQILQYMGLQEWADDRGFIVIAPDSSGEEDYEWSFSDGERNNRDGLFFDDLLACSAATWGIDRDNVHSMGMSAGGVWTTWLTFYRADMLASTAPLSGGTSVYVSPEVPLPVLITWGGPDDTYQGYSFEDASTTLSEGLRGDGAFVVECVHDGGHTIPRQATDYLGQWFTDHPRPLPSEPYAEGLPASFPDWCRIP